MNKTISYLSETVAALKESNREMNKSNAELLAKLMSISQRLSKDMVLLSLYFYVIQYFEFH